MKLNKIHNSIPTIPTVRIPCIVSIYISSRRRCRRDSALCSYVKKYCWPFCMWVFFFALLVLKFYVFLIIFSNCFYPKWKEGGGNRGAGGREAFSGPIYFLILYASCACFRIVALFTFSCLWEFEKKSPQGGGIKESTFNIIIVGTKIFCSFLFSLYCRKISTTPPCFAWKMWHFKCSEK